MPAHSADPRAQASVSPIPATHTRDALRSKITRGALVGGACVLLIGTAAVAGPAQAASPVVAATAVSETAAGTGLKVTDTPIAAVAAASKSSAALKTTAAEGLEAPGGTRLLAYIKRDAVQGFSLYGVTWDHRSQEPRITVSIRTRADGTWSKWTELEADHDGGPSSGREDSSFRDGTEPAWVGDASGVEVAVFGTGKAPTGLKVSTIDPGPDPVGVAATPAATGSAKTSKSGASRPSHPS